MDHDNIDNLVLLLNKGLGKQTTFLGNPPTHDIIINQ